MNNKDKEAINKKLEKILDDAVNLQIKNPEAGAEMFKNCYIPTKRYNSTKKTYKLVETKSFYHIKKICDGIETHFTKCRKEDLSKERVEKIIERLNQLRNRD